MSDAGNREDYDRSRSKSPRRERRRSRSRSQRRSFSPRSRSPSQRRDRRRSRSPRRDDDYHRGGYRGSDRSGGGGSSQGRRVYVGNLPYDVKWGHLKDFMRAAGDVLHADVLSGPDGRSKGCGVVEYATTSDAQRAIAELSNQTLHGRMVYIREDREQDKGFGNSRGGRGGYDRPSGGYTSSAIQGQITQPQIYITNLPYSIGWQDLKDLFRNAGSIVRADVHIGSDGRSKGTGVVMFESTADAQNAYKQFQGYDWQGRMLEIREDRFASSSRGGRGGGGGGYPDRGSRGGGRGGYDDGYDSYRVPPLAPIVEPNPFTDDAWGNGEPSAIIYVKNLPWSTSNDDLVELFSTIGKVERAEICYEPSGRSKGSGVVQFDGQEGATVAIQKFTGYPYGGRPLGISFVRYENEHAGGNNNAMPQPYVTDAQQQQQQPHSSNAPYDDGYGGSGGDDVQMATLPEPQ